MHRSTDLNLLRCANIGQPDATENRLVNVDRKMASGHKTERVIVVESNIGQCWNWNQRKWYMYCKVCYTSPMLCTQAVCTLIHFM